MEVTGWIDTDNGSNAYIVGVKIMEKEQYFRKMERKKIEIC